MKRFNRYLLLGLFALCINVSCGSVSAPSADGGESADGNPGDPDGNPGDPDGASDAAEQTCTWTTSNWDACNWAP